MVAFLYCRRFSPDMVELSNMVVASWIRRSGLGARMVGTLEPQLIELGFRAAIFVNCRLHVGASDAAAAAARAFWLHQGYRIVFSTPRIGGLHEIPGCRRPTAAGLTSAAIGVVGRRGAHDQGARSPDRARRGSQAARTRISVTRCLARGPGDRLVTPREGWRASSQRVSYSRTGPLGASPARCRQHARCASRPGCSIPRRRSCQSAPPRHPAEVGHDDHHAYLAGLGRTREGREHDVALSSARSRPVAARPTTLAGGSRRCVIICPPDVMPGRRVGGARSPARRPRPVSRRGPSPQHRRRRRRR